MKCLNCNREMMNHSVHTKKQQISYDLCEDCGSLWLDKGELDKMAFRVQGSIEYCSTKKTADTDENLKSCPRCERKDLDKVRFIGCGDVVLDHCSNCGGFWLDGGELNLINRELEDIMPVQGKGFSEFVNNVHVPYWHKRIKAKSSETDFKVDVPPVKGAKLISQTEYTCPACPSKLNQYKVFAAQIEGCPKCRGIFLDQGELQKLKDKCEKGEWQNLRWLDDETDSIEKTDVRLSDRVCPKCKPQKLLTTGFGDSKTLLDYCPQCHGVWLDEGEFREIHDYLFSEVNKYSSSQMAKKVYEEIKEIWSGPENILSEILDAKAAISALICITIFSRPALFNKLQEISRDAGAIGLG